MSDSLFGPTSTPSWMAPEQRDSILEGEGRANAASFDQAFQASYGRKQQEELDEKLLEKKKALGMATDEENRNRILGKGEFMAKALEGVNDTEGYLKATVKYPWLGMDPDTQAPWMQMGKNFMTHDAIKMKSELALDNLEIKRDQVDNNSAQSKISVNNAKEFTKQLATVTDPAEQVRIQGLAKGGMPTDEAWRALQAAPKLDPKIAEIRERGGEARKTEDVRQDNREVQAGVKAGYAEDLSKLNAQQKSDYEKQRQQDRIDLKKLDIMGKETIEKMKEDAKQGDGGQKSEDYFVNRHFNSVMTVEQGMNKYATGANKKSVHDMEADVDSSLRALYRASRQKTAAPATKATPAPAPSDAGANAPVTNVKDPLGLFK